ncbi:MAG: type II toxin-antitoxin system RelE/ParE family toxin [Pseudomonadota bacterium]
MAIKGWKSRKLKRFYEKGKSAGIPAQMESKLETRLDALHAAAEVGDMDLPGWGFHPLKGNRAGTYAVKVTGNWRVTFEFEDGNAYVVDLEDYH